MLTKKLTLASLLDPLVSCFTPKVVAKLADLRAPETVQSRIDYLAEQCNEGALTADEAEEYEQCVYALNFIAILQAGARAKLKSGTSQTE